MIAYYGFKDGSGDWFLAVDADKCNGCGKCTEVCPAGALEVGEDEYNPLRNQRVVKIQEDKRKNLKYTCAPCKPGYGEKSPPCVAACEPRAISHSDGWKRVFSQE